MTAVGIEPRSPIESSALSSAHDSLYVGYCEGARGSGVVLPYLGPTELAAGKVALGHTPFPKYPASPGRSRFEDGAKG